MGAQPPILVTGGCGFIGANFVLEWLADETAPVVNLDALTYAGNAESLTAIARDPRYTFVHGDVTDAALLARLLREHRPRAIVHFAAETHVDRSIHDPGPFLRTNIDGTFTLLEAARTYYDSLEEEERGAFRFLHISTDEVFGSLSSGDAPFVENSPYAPNSPYAASKAASDHLVRAWHRTYGLPTLVTHCSNNYGPFQFPEKLIPLVIDRALEGEPLPVYGDGQQVRDWLFVTDHCAALRRVLSAGVPGASYNIGGDNQRTNLEVVLTVCALLDEIIPPSDDVPHANLIRFVSDRPGHDRRYAIDAGKISTELGWRPAHTLETGLRDTVQWYLHHREWTRLVTTKTYRACDTKTEGSR